MPELPEVEIVARELRTTIIGKKISGIEVQWNRSFVNQSRTQPNGQSIISISRKGKYLIVALSASYFIIHLRMTGQLIFKEDHHQNPDPYTRVQVCFSDSSRLFFRDTRKFGRIYHVDDPMILLKRIGMDAVDPNMTSEFFRKILSRRDMGIKALLLSQDEISGLGNIYADESLFRAGIHPATKAQQISDKKTQILYETIRHILESAIANMGSTISDYRDVYGNSGSNQAFFKVYQRTGAPCLKCGTPIKRITVGSRGTHFCPKCQALPRKRSKKHVR